MTPDERLIKIADVVQRYLDGLITDDEAMREIVMIVAYS